MKLYHRILLQLGASAWFKTCCNRLILLTCSLTFSSSSVIAVRFILVRVFKRAFF